MESVPPCQLRMSDGLPARWTPPCQGPFTSCGCPLICVMTNDYPVKSRAGGHGIPMSVCVCMREGFYMLSRGSLFGGFQCEGAPPPHSVCSPVAAGEEEEEEEEERCLRRRQGWLREDREGGQTQGIRRHTHCDGTSSEDTLSDLWPDCFTLLKGHSVVLEKELRILTFAVLVSS